MITVLAGGPLATVQDLGRTGHRAIGIASAGPMDRVGLQLGNLLVGNAMHQAGIEIAASGFIVRFEQDGWFALTGADCSARLDDAPILPRWTAPARKGQILVLQAPARGVFAYLCFAGGVDLEPVIGSRSTDLKGGFGGIGGRALASNDVLPLGKLLRPRRIVETSGFGLRPREMRFHAEGAIKRPVTLRTIPAAEYEVFVPESRQTFWTTNWSIQRDSNRVGYRLSGTALQFSERRELFSHGILPGVVQVPPSGQPVVQMVDGNTCGGYPKIGTIISADVSRLAQIMPGDTVRFVEVTQQEAVAAVKAEDDYLRGIERVISLAEMSRLAT